jgi:phenylacetate-CoA ligase
MAEFINALRRWRHTAIPLPVKYGRRFRRLFKFLMEHQHASREELERYQWQRLKALLDYAYRQVPFYRQRFDDLDLHPKDILTPVDFRQIPLLTRDEVMHNQEELKSTEFAKFKPYTSITSGTSRDHLKVFRSREAEDWRKAMMWRHFFNIGYHFREPRAQFVGPLHFLTDHDEMPIDYNENLLMIEQNAIRRDNTKRVYHRMREFRPKLLYCQPANIAALVLYFEEHGLEPFHLPIIYTTGEVIYPQYRRALERFFGCLIVDYYGNRENTVAAMQLADGRKYIQSEFCYLEFANNEGQEINGEQANIIATSLVNYAFPLIRYQTDDIGIYYGHPQDAVSDYPVMEIIGGRGKDLILSREGLIFPQVDFEFSETRFERVRVEQLSLEHLHVTYVPTHNFKGADDEEWLRQLYDEYFKNEFKVTIEQVADILFTESGKNKLYVSKLAMDYLDRQE